MESKITSKGQITIPKRIREKWGLKTGERVIFQMRRDEAILTPKVENPLQELIKLRREIPLFSEKEIKEMIKSSKKEWSKI